MSSGWSAPGASGSDHEELQDPLAPGAARSGAGFPPPGQTGTGPQRELVQQIPLFPLRPLGLGEVLGAAVRIYRQRARATLALAAVVYGVAFVVITLATGAGMIPLLGEMQAVMDDPTAETEFSTVGDLLGTLASSLVTWIVSVIAAAVVTVVLTRIAIGEASGDPLPSSQIWPTIRRFSVPATAVATISAALGTIALLVPALIGALPLLLLQEANVVLVLCVVLGVVIGILGAIWIWARTLLAVPAMAIENCGVLTALRRSFAMTSGKKLWRVLGSGVLLYVLYLIASQIIAGVFGTVAAVAYLAVLLATQMEGLVLGLALLTVISMIGAYIGTFLLAPFYSAGIAALYADNRMRHEAWDIELNRSARSSAAGNEGDPADASVFGAPRSPEPWESR